MCAAASPSTEWPAVTNYRRTWFASFDLLNLEAKINALYEKFPYQTTIKATKSDYEKDRNAAITEGLAITAASWFFIYQLAKRGVVLPLLRQYGSQFKTHRVFRHYLYSLVLPVPALLLFNTYQYSNHVEYLWSVHLNRLNDRITTQPKGTILPLHLRPGKFNVELYAPYRTIQDSERLEKESKLPLETFGKVILEGEDEEAEEAVAEPQAVESAPAEEAEPAAEEE